jgi:hypothetical protein
LFQIYIEGKIKQDINNFNETASRIRERERESRGEKKKREQ